MAYRKITLQTVIALAATLACIAAFVVVVDPYQHYHANPTYYGNQRSEIGGVARHHDYDAVITGSSMAMNHYPAQADSLWGWKTKNFSIMGATDDDYATILPYIIAQGKAKHIIMGVDFFSFARSRGAVPEYLYDDNPLNDYKYLWNYTSLTAALNYARSGGVREEDLYHFNSPVSREALLHDFRGHFKSGYGDLTDGGGEVFDYQQCTERFKNSVLKTVADSPDIGWLIYFPPYSIAEFIIYDTHGDLDAILRMREYFARSLCALPNVTLYDFQRPEWISDTDQYMDLRHHSHEYNRRIIKCIHDGAYVANPDSVRAGSLRLRNEVDRLRDSFIKEL